ncbi:hypothetical protein BIFDEN_01331 [Bifidobacterium dentium ATCC 27678]|uniref:DUF4012 domain-containing protein n=2 Tax=Bifidobacterium dentium TaxID=1689 RepID=D2Q637_BIFDB|nr:Conserved hypothetical protein [Bifidobacterium dentium Bd1]EDT45500.1 hypothetical protein BIFDEN_01331 [Bifidobacterium dentium ATCC 27678]BAQ27713.1 conserved hypothetical protein [Bifidobacterium dentium JCM 1195 = DSM 20436]
MAKGGAAKKVAIAVAAVLGVIVIYCALLVGSVLQVKRHATQAVSIVQSAIGSDIPSALPALADKMAQLQQETKAARSQTDGIVWRISTMIPYFGDDFSAVRTAVTALDTMSNDVAPNVSDALEKLQQQDIASGGTLNVKPLSSMADTIVQANTVIQKQSKALENAPESHVGKVRNVLETGTTLFAKVANQSNQLTKVVSMFSQLVDGGEGKYLIMVQSNAEAQAAGGVPGSIGSLDVEDGKISVGEFHSDSEFQLVGDIDGTEQINQMYAISQFGVDYGGDIRIATVSPNFPIVAKYATGVWKQQSFGANDTIKGVMSLDPYALQSLLGILGEVTLSNGVQLDGNNTAQYLSNTVYRDIPDQNQQDAFFKESAQLIMQKVFGSFDAKNMFSLVKTMSVLGQQRHIYNVGFVDSGKSEWNGELSNDPKQPETGLFVNEMGWSKMDWYAKRSAVVTKMKINQDGTTTWHVSYTIANSMKPEEVESTPEYITSTFPTSFFEDLIAQGDMSDEERAFATVMISKAQPGVLWHIYVIEPPAGGSVSDIKVSNNSASRVQEGEQFSKIKSDGRDYYTNVGVLIDPGCTAVVEYNVTTAAGASDLKLDETPVPYTPQIVYEDKTKE